ncbi:hypothetical protein TVAG_282940 [Trichomonas vaginalis G3]|uniref:Uncharacterized protein n=1 Tax=Trichomonas vaginalis (strain ATCC PRA-98 / G3) TaxID=412133 RepID=A2DEJ7_TRIV3|nr:hypothetical protein TVAGG3_0577910 [Trichomonas vaginalis G3]EAY21124.1 hypothetical protein TVAG_282940 [Trichomonas vaginalis G3]KAI5522351.1 hypothetical protein TVAGG3_0577910 [Trichomonas vaginalis G3]|eukprot:XP_001582110.1 hypothetical protein [Trichomonas vaginalis G3]
MQSSNSNKFETFTEILMYVPTAIILFISFTFAIYILNSDNDPPALPTNSRDYSYDCPYIKQESLSVNDSRLSFKFKVGDFLQFPKQTAMSMLKVDVQTGLFKATYNMSSIWDRQGNISEISFNVLHPIIGDAIITTRCGNYPIAFDQKTISSVNIYPIGFTRLMQGYFASAIVGNGCWENTDISFFITNDIQVRPFVVGKNDFQPVAVNNGNFDPKAYADYFNITYYDSPNDLAVMAVFVTANPHFAYETIIDVIIPVSFYSKSNEGSGHCLVLTKDQNDLRPIVEKIFDGEIIEKDRKVCYKNGAVLTSSTGLRYDIDPDLHNFDENLGYIIRFQEIFNIDREIFADIKQKFTSKKMKNKQITVVEKLKFLIPTLKNLYPKAKIEVIHDTDSISYIASIVSRSRILIGTNIFNLAYSVFLNEGATLVEYQISGEEGSNLLSKWAEVTKTNYLVIPHKYDNKPIDSYSNYFKLVNHLPFPHPNPQLIKEIFDQKFPDLN